MKKMKALILAAGQGTKLFVKGVVSGYHYSTSVQGYYITDATGTVYVYGSQVAATVNVGDEIIFVKQYRSGAEKVLLELPAGIVDKNESPLDAAIRELKEETKYSSAKITYLGGYYSSPGFTNELVHLYLAEELFASSLDCDDDEFIELSKYNIKQIKRLLTSNTITDMKTALGLLMYLNSKNDQSNWYLIGFFIHKPTINKSSN